MERIVSIIMPVYNAESTILHSLKSIMSQHQSWIELIVVDDCSTDRSASIVNETIASSTRQDMSIVLLRHENNRGVAAARNSGLDAATGKYIYYVDADDRIEPYTLEKLVREAESAGADIVGHNWYLSFEGNERKMHEPGFANPSEALRLMMAGAMRWNLWLFLVRKSLYDEHQIRFIEGLNMGEDMMVMLKLFANAEKVSFIDEALYHYMQTNVSSLTKTYSEEHIRQVTANVGEAEKYLDKSSYSDKLNVYIYQLKLNIKLPLLISDDKKRYQQWIDWFPEANFQIMHNKYLPLRIRLLQLAASKRQFWLVWLYYRIVVKFMYGIIYK
ncbi:MAG: glycosyl transferase family A [Bacteroidales bacterium 45-6]|nr:MAG: glycosyl transferase family A [Bacteroidales bacterium 45-6]